MALLTMHVYQVSPYILLVSLGGMLLDVNSQWNMKEFPGSDWDLKSTQNVDSEDIAMFRTATSSYLHAINLWAFCKHLGVRI